MRVRSALLTILWLLVGTVTPARAALSKKDAFELLRSNGHRWQQTEYLPLDAEAKKQQAESALSPHLGIYSRQLAGRVNQVQFGFSDAGPLTWFAFGSTGIEVGYAIYDGASRARLEAAKENLQITNNTKQQYQSDLTYLMLYQYLNVQRLKKNLAVIEANIERDQAILEFARQRVRAGAGIELDRNRAEGLLQRDQFRHVDAKTSLFKSCQELNVTLGQNDGTCDVEPLALHILPEEKLVDPDKKDLSAKFDLVAAQHTINAAEHLKDFAKKEAGPKITVFADTGVAGEYLFGGANSAAVGMVGVQMKMPLYDGDYTSGRVQEESVKVMQATAQHSQIEAEDRSQLRISISQLRDAKLAVDLSLKQIELAKEELRMSQRKYSVGGLSSLELSNAQLNVASALDLNVQAIFAYEMAKVTYFKSIDQLPQYFEIEGAK